MCDFAGLTDHPKLLRASALDRWRDNLVQIAGIFLFGKSLFVQHEKQFDAGRLDIFRARNRRLRFFPGLVRLSPAVLSLGAHTIRVLHRSLAGAIGARMCQIIPELHYIWNVFGRARIPF